MIVEYMEDFFDQITELNSSLNKYTENREKLMMSIQNLSDINSVQLNYIKDKLNFINNKINEISDDIEELQYNIDYNEINKNININNRIKNYEINKKIYELFAPYMIAYSILLHNE